MRGSVTPGLPNIWTSLFARPCSFRLEVPAPERNRSVVGVVRLASAMLSGDSREGEGVKSEASGGSTYLLNKSLSFKGLSVELGEVMLDSSIASYGVGLGGKEIFPAALHPPVG